MFERVPWLWASAAHLAVTERQLRLLQPWLLRPCMSPRPRGQEVPAAGGGLFARDSRRFRRLLHGTHVSRQALKNRPS